MKRFYKNDKPSEEIQKKLQRWKKKKIFEFMRTGRMPKRLDKDKTDRYFKAKDKWEEEGGEEEEDEQADEQEDVSRY